MSNLRLGACLPNVDEPDEASFNRLRSMRAHQVGVLWTRGDRNGVGGTQHRRPVYERLESELSKPTYDLRIGPSRQITDTEWLNWALAALAEVPEAIIKDGRLKLRVLNEVNMLSEGLWTPLGYFNLLTTIHATKPKTLTVPIVCAPISFGDPGWFDWLTTFDAICLDKGHPFDRRAVNAYAHLLGEVHRFIGPKPVDVTELNTLELPPGRSRGRWIVDRASMLGQLGVESAQVFIAGGTSHGAWPEGYILADDEADEIGKRGPIGITAVDVKPAPEVIQVPQNPPREDVIARIHNRAEEYGFPLPDILVKQIGQESGFRHYNDDGSILGSSAGAKGIAQFMPAYWPPETYETWQGGIDAQVRWMTDLYAQWRSIPLALVNYNGGSGAVFAWMDGKPYDESVDYVTAILGDVTVAQFTDLADLGYSATVAKNVCSGIAIHGASRMLGIPLDIKTVIDTMWSDRSLWTTNDDLAGSNAFLEALSWFGVSGTFIDEDRARIALWAGHPVVLSTPKHYYCAQRPSRTENELYVGNTGLARINGTVWMSPDTIRVRDGGLEMIEITHADGAVVPIETPETPDTITAILDGLWEETEQLAAIDHQARAERMQEKIGALKVAIGR